MPHKLQIQSDDELEQALDAAFKRMSAAQKLDLMVVMYRAGLARRSAGLKMRHPEWTDEQVDLEARRGLLHART